MAPLFMRRVLCILALIALLDILLIAGESKLEADLRAKLAVSEAARVAALKDKAALATALDRIIKTDTTVQSSQHTASESARIAQQNSEDQTLLIQQAAIAASTAALIAQQQAHTFNSNSIAMIAVEVLVLLGILGGFLNSAMIAARDHRWTQQARAEDRAVAKETQAAVAAIKAPMEELAVNTNHIKDALVKVTGAWSRERPIWDEQKQTKGMKKNRSFPL